ncbi:hypothetical protein GCM10028857_06390 [Salinarchaeum chitinilyticum]
MERVAFDAVDPAPSAGAATAHRLSDVLGTEAVAINHYAVAPGERVSGLHAHGDQEELFVVLEGTATIETLDGPVDVDAGETVRFAPGEYQSVTNDARSSLEVLAIGAPRDSTDIRIPLPCPNCDHEFREPTRTDSGPALTCPACDEQQPAICSACGSHELQAVLDADGEPVSRCSECGAKQEP